MTVFFTADTHFGHENVIKYARRPFRNADEMDIELVKKWNAVVNPDDLVYHVGDVALCSFPRAMWLVSSLYGRKRLVFGNHDKILRKKKEFIALFEHTSDIFEVRVEDPSCEWGYQPIVLCHYAMRVWNKSHYGAWQLYGHSHGSLSDDVHSLSLDVGVDCWNYAPVSYDVIRARMVKKVWKPIDHHGEKREDE